MGTFAIGVDFGTESARAVVLDLSSGAELAAAVSPYTHGVMDKVLLENGKTLPAQWALQDAQDYLQSLKESVNAAIEKSEIDPAEVISVGIDTTACTVVPVDEALRPLSSLPEYKQDPYAYVRLWKDHASVPYTNRLNKALESVPHFLEYYGGALSPEWLLPKALLMFEESPQTYQATAKFIEQEDWIVSQLVGHEVRGAHVAGYKGSYRVENEGYPSSELLEEVSKGFSSVLSKIGKNFLNPGDCAGKLTEEWASALNLSAGISVAIGNMDAHVAVLGAGCITPGTLVAVMGTSVCDLVMSEKLRAVQGIQGVVKNGIIPGLWGYEAGQAGVGDTFGWFVKILQETQIGNDIDKSDIFSLLESGAEKVPAAGTGIIALDWQNGNRSILINSDLSGVFVGLTTTTSVYEMYRALLEGVACGQRMILEAFEKADVPISRIVACGGLSKKSPLLMQIFADVTGREIEVTASEHTPALGAALHGAIAAKSISWDKASELARKETTLYKPNQHTHALYEEYFTLYRHVHDVFGVDHPELMKKLRELYRQSH